MALRFREVDVPVLSKRFDEFFRETYGHDPFPWQRRLAVEVLQGDGWPRAMHIPTGSGKTAVMDIAVFALACEADSPARRTSRRIFFVVDRRIVVDDAYRRAEALAARLREAQSSAGGVLHEVAVRLMRLGGEVPLQAAAMRGGMYLNHDWARNPAQPLVCVSTVDQVGSRLLFRGYGLDATRPNNMLPIHAALIGTDALVILDEAHMSVAFADTLESIGRFRPWAERPIGKPWGVVVMSATLNRDVGGVFTETNEDREHPVLGPRLQASKPARLIEVNVESAGPKDRDAKSVERARQQQFVERVYEEAVRLLNEGRAGVIGVVLNRVLTARQVFDRLQSLPDADAVLLTGRVRPIERDALLTRYLDRMKAGREPAAGDRPLFVVATQTVEVGADLDFDALVTECAPLDALRQRFGRLNRLGQLRDTRAVILARSDQVSRGAEDAVYGPALARTWEWLKTVAAGAKGKRRSRTSGNDLAVDMGVRHLAQHLPSGDGLAEICAPVRPAPVLLPGHLDLWAQTSPRPRPDPDVALFLHGQESAVPDVQVVWRTDLAPEEPLTWADTVALLPPVSIEAMPVPLSAVRAWLQQSGTPDFADVEGVSTGTTARSAEPRLALRWAGPGSEGTGPVRPEELKPGDTIVVPCAYGGADPFGWAPLSTEPVVDVAMEAYLRHQDIYSLRIHPSLATASWPNADDLERAQEAWAQLEELVDRFGTADLSDDEAHELTNQLLSAVSAAGWVREAVRQVAAGLLRLPAVRRGLLIYPDGKGVVITARSAVEAADELTDEDDASSFGRPVGLAQHLRGVEATVGEMARACGLSKELQEDLVLAARYHDVGKTDPRFQIMLYGGDEVAAAVGEVRAKSGLDARDRRSIHNAWQQSGLPRQYRHEATSLALVQAAPAWLSNAHDPDLVLHLIAAHHGCARPFMPGVSDRRAAEYRSAWDGVESTIPADCLGALDSGVAERFWRLTDRYGWYGLAYLEAILRLADHRQSEKERYGRHD